MVFQPLMVADHSKTCGLIPIRREQRHTAAGLSAIEVIRKDGQVATSAKQMMQQLDFAKIMLSAFS